MTQSSSGYRRPAGPPGSTGSRPPSRYAPRNDKDKPAGRGRFFVRRRVCHFCVDKVESIDYKDVPKLSRYVSDRARIQPRRRSGVCARHQRALATAIKRARHLALLPFTLSHIRESGMSFGPPPRVGFGRDRRPEPQAPVSQTEAVAAEGAEAKSAP
jgi:small subunit ribosomal protein S18